MQLALDVQRVLDRFLTANRWQHRQQEIVRRRDRDGEAFLRFFALPDGSTQVRFVDPAEVSTPPERRDDPGRQFRRPNRSGRRRDGPDLLHRRPGGRRGRHPTPQGQCRRQREARPATFYPVRKNLRRAEKLLRNMSTVAEIQAAIA